jgi:enoyl-CoA hydratase
MVKNNILTNIKDQIAFVTINRPHKLNILNAETITELYQVFKKLKENEEVKVIILSGGGNKAFVAGSDLKEILRHDNISGRIFATRGQKVFRFIQKMPKPVIAAINGYALGAGCELVLFCHLRIAAENAEFGQPEIRLGLIPAHGATQYLLRIIGISNALYFLLTGKSIDAKKALEFGLVNEVVPLDKLIPRATELAKRLIANSSIATQLILQATTQSLELNFDQGLDLEAELFGNICDNEDSKEGISAFLEKRKPKFTGKTK